MARQLWKKRDDETSQQYEAFQCYYLLDPAVRSLKEAVKEFQRRAGKPEDQIGGMNSRFSYWSAQHDWVLRSEAWDEHVFEQREKAHLKGTAKGAEKNAVNIEKMRAELGTKFDEIGEGADDLLGKILENPDKYNIKLSEINGLQRVRLDIFRALTKGDTGGGATQDAEIEKMVRNW